MKHEVELSEECKGKFSSLVRPLKGGKGSLSESLFARINSVDELEPPRDSVGIAEYTIFHDDGQEENCKGIYHKRGKILIFDTLDECKEFYSKENE